MPDKLLIKPGKQPMQHPCRMYAHAYPAHAHVTSRCYACSMPTLFETSCSQAIIVGYGFASALRGFCFSILNNKMTMRLRYILLHLLDLAGFISMQQSLDRLLSQHVGSHDVPHRTLVCMPM